MPCVGVTISPSKSRAHLHVARSRPYTNGESWSSPSLWWRERRKALQRYGGNVSPTKFTSLIQIDSNSLSLSLSTPHTHTHTQETWNLFFAENEKTLWWKVKLNLRTSHDQHCSNLFGPTNNIPKNKLSSQPNVVGELTYQLLVWKCENAQNICIKSEFS